MRPERWFILGVPPGLLWKQGKQQCACACAYCQVRPESTCITDQPRCKCRTESELVLGEQGRSPATTVGIDDEGDPYEPEEKRCEETRRRLESLAEAGQPAMVVTRSNLVLRDLDLLAKIARRGSATVMMRLATVDPEMAGLWEPKWPSPDRRLAALRDLWAAGIATGLAAGPLVPFLMDGHTQLQELLFQAEQAGAGFFDLSFLELKPGPSRQQAQLLVAQSYPTLLAPLMELYGEAHCPPPAYVDRVVADAGRIATSLGLADRAPDSWSPGRLLRTAFASRLREPPFVGPR